MLNDAQRTSLCIVMRLIEEKMQAIEPRLDRPEEQGLMAEVRNDITPAIAHALREKVTEVYRLIRTLRDRLALSPAIKPASREVLKGLAPLWVMLQESDSKRLRRYGGVDCALAPVLDPQIKALARLMVELEDVVLPSGAASPHHIATEEKAYDTPGRHIRALV